MGGRERNRTPVMREARAQVVLLVRAFEEADHEGRLLPIRARAAATRRALVVTGLADRTEELTGADSARISEIVLRRARLLFNSLGRRIPVLDRVLHVARLGTGTGPTIVLAALALGLLTNILGPERRINLLSFPMFGLLAWNLAIYALMAGMAIVALTRDRNARASSHRFVRAALSNHLAGWFLRGALWRRLHGWKITRSGTKDDVRVITRALVRFGALWHRHAGSLLAARVRRMLHTGAVAAVAGAVSGMYLRGFAFEYRATWESTWLDASRVQALLGVVLGPAAAVLGVRLPDVGPLHDRPGDAAVWIHLWAMTAVLFVVVPRAVLASTEGWRSIRLSARLPVELEDPYFRRLLTAWRGATRCVEVVPYSFSPKPGAVEALRALLYDFFGARADVRIRGPLAYGADAAETVAIDEGSSPAADPNGERPETCHVLVFNLAQSPEMEVHGAFLEELKGQVDDRRGQLLVLIEGAAYRGRVREPGRQDERLRAWTRIMKEVGLQAVDVNLEPSADLTPRGDAMERLTRSMQAALWPSRDTEREG